MYEIQGWASHQNHPEMQGLASQHNDSLNSRVSITSELLKCNDRSQGFIGWNFIKIQGWSSHYIYQSIRPVDKKTRSEKFMS